MHTVNNYLMTIILLMVLRVYAQLEGTKDHCCDAEAKERNRDN